MDCQIIDGEKDNKTRNVHMFRKVDEGKTRKDGGSIESSDRTVSVGKYVRMQCDMKPGTSGIE